MSVSLPMSRNVDRRWRASNTPQLQVLRTTTFKKRSTQGRAQLTPERHCCCDCWRCLSGSNFLSLGAQMSVRVPQHRWQGCRTSCRARKRHRGDVVPMYSEWWLRLKRDFYRESADKREKNLSSRLRPIQEGVCPNPVVLSYICRTPNGFKPHITHAGIPQDTMPWAASSRCFSVPNRTPALPNFTVYPSTVNGDLTLRVGWWCGGDNDKVHRVFEYLCAPPQCWPWHSLLPL